MAAKIMQFGAVYDLVLRLLLKKRGKLNFTCTCALGAHEHAKNTCFEARVTPLAH